MSISFYPLAEFSSKFGFFYALILTFPTRKQDLILLFINKNEIYYICTIIVLKVESAI